MKRIAFFASNGAAGTDLAHVASVLPIYRNRAWGDGGPLDELVGRQPFLDREELRRWSPQGFLRDGDSLAGVLAAKRAELVRTSGTSSDRLQILWETDWWEKQEFSAAEAHPAMAPYLSGTHTEAVLTTPLCSESVCKTGPSTMDERRVDNLLFLNTQHDPTRWSRTDIERMAAELDEFRPTSIEADPVYLGSFLRGCRDLDLTFSPPRWITLTYEFVSALDKALIRNHCTCPSFEYYGLTEAGVFFLECADGRHHFCATDAAVEIIRDDDRLPGDVGEVVVTTWGNSLGPLVRYRTGDLVRVSSGNCACERSEATIDRFEGRRRDLLIIEDDRLFTPRMLDDAIAGVADVSQYRCVQTPEGLDIEYKQDHGVDPGKEIEARFGELMGDVPARAVPVPFIAPEPSGKYRTVVPLTS